MRMRKVGFNCHHQDSLGTSNSPMSDQNGQLHLIEFHWEEPGLIVQVGFWGRGAPKTVNLGTGQSLLWLIQP